MPNGYLFPWTGKKMTNFDHSHSFDFCRHRSDKIGCEHCFIKGYSGGITV